MELLTKGDGSPLKKEVDRLKTVIHLKIEGLKAIRSITEDETKMQLIEAIENWFSTEFKISERYLE